ncbi:MAG: glycosyltransferase family A protein [Cryobacterium sp.]
MDEPLVDHIIAVHNPRRPIARAVGSVLKHTDAPIRVSVICHNTDPDEIRIALGELANDPRLRLLELQDGVRSPSGPFNAGMDAATAPFTSIMGSDDELEPGAIDSWLAVQRRDRADVVIPRLVHAGAANVPTPPSRPFRSSSLDGVRDRLSYRSAPLGLVSRERFGRLRLMSGAGTGGDVEYSSALWFSGARISRDRRGPAYRIHNDASDRVTLAPKPVADDFIFLVRLLASELLGALTPTQREALIVKILRVHIFGTVHNRPDPSLWTAAERATLAAGLKSCVDAAPHALEVLSRSDRALIDVIDDVGAPADDLLAAAARRRRYYSPLSLVPRNPLLVFARQAPLRFAVASALVRAGL